MIWRASILAILVFCAGGWVRASGPRELPLEAPLSAFPLRLDAWRGVEGPAIEPDVARVLRADDYLNRIYQRGNAAVVGLWIAFYASQRQGDAIHSPLNCFPGTGWVPLQHTRPVLSVNGQPFRVNRYVVEKRGERQVVLYWYQGRGRVVASEYANKAFLLVDGFRRQRTDGALVRVTAPVLRDETLADDAAAGFVAALQPQLGRWLP